MKLIHGADTPGLGRAETDALIDAYQDAIAWGLSKDFIRLLEEELLRRGVITDKDRRKG
ncbi:sporulation histidine kinase inhibitor Sda [Paenibacillus xanthanilyticus]|uniref:Sporulation histidine kinase inhibitor Sda n=1 Tax=Paenibacillus xanthanilyticus TaxID=1783531 RepID=A0ABV8K8W0_9BACL